jgi:hypothetical protein
LPVWPILSGWLGGPLPYPLPRDTIQRGLGIVIGGIDFEEAPEPPSRALHTPRTLGNTTEFLERDDVLGVEPKHLLEHFAGLIIVLLVDQAAAQNDVSAYVIGPLFEPLARNFPRKIERPLLTIRLSKCREPLGRILVVASLEFFDLGLLSHDRPMVPPISK